MRRRDFLGLIGGGCIGMVLPWRMPAETSVPCPVIPLHRHPDGCFYVVDNPTYAFEFTGFHDANGKWLEEP